MVKSTQRWKYTVNPNTSDQRTQHEEIIYDIHKNLTLTYTWALMLEEVNKQEMLVIAKPLDTKIWLSLALQLNLKLLMYAQWSNMSVTEHSSLRQKCSLLSCIQIPKAGLLSNKCCSLQANYFRMRLVIISKSTCMKDMMHLLQLVVFVFLGFFFFNFRVNKSAPTRQHSSRV